MDDMTLPTIALVVSIVSLGYSIFSYLKIRYW